MKSGNEIQLAINKLNYLPKKNIDTNIFEEHSIKFLLLNIFEFILDSSVIEVKTQDLYANLMLFIRYSSKQKRRINKNFIFKTLLSIFLC